MVVMRLPAAALSGVLQERTGWPFRCTTQAPQSDVPQPYFVPVSESFSRITHNRGISAGASTWLRLPLTISVIMGGLLVLESGHGETSFVEVGHEGSLLRRRQLHEGRPHGGPRGFAAVVRDGALEGGNHGVLREDAANGVEPLLLRIGVRVLPRGEEPRDGARVDVGRRADAADAAVAQSLEEEGLASREHVEAGLGEVVQVRLGVVPVTRGILGT